MHDHQDENCHNPVREEGYLFWKTSAQGRMLFSAQCKTGEKKLSVNLLFMAERFRMKH
ncbi:Uncharacterised protein [Serratia liquefaciens]|nr:Uncharacterised protein [Serratia liquefaciens]CAI2068693.1 Uncharacterised protein [Serratia liquefaciens]CAI2437192.1 Uncharacterised protein [Serratia liquefaciens]